MQLLFIILSTLIGYATSCPFNCVCEEVTTTCSLYDCDDELPFYFTSKMEIYGKLCPSHRHHLKQEVFEQTIILLHDDVCEDISNCL